MKQLSILAVIFSRGSIYWVLSSRADFVHWKNWIPLWLQVLLMGNFLIAWISQRWSPFSMQQPPSSFLVNRFQLLFGWLWHLLSLVSPLALTYNSTATLILSVLSLVDLLCARTASNLSGDVKDFLVDLIPWMIYFVLQQVSLWHQWPSSPLTGRVL